MGREQSGERADAVRHEHGGERGPPAPAPPPGTTLTSNTIDTLSRNIAGIESGGWKNPYEALNPTTHAIGKYQVMPSNVAGWTQAALGSSMTPDEFKASPSAQEAIFRDQMQRSLQLYGPKDAASIWFTGKPYNVAGGAATDANKTTNASYVAQATAGLDDSGTFKPGPAVAASSGTPTAGQGGGSIVGALTTPGADGKQSPLQQAMGSVGKAMDAYGQQDQQQPQVNTQQQLLSQQAAAPIGMQRQQMVANQAQQLAASLGQRAMAPLTWNSAPPGSTPGAGAGQAPQVDPQAMAAQMMAMGRGVPGTTLNSIGDYGYG